ncbi:hypothetical protein IJH15_02730 [Candidatus Saccharibacteria bacterium]|nr:hypothetical protein [Candidatus Saccharibacteria bacterium]
MVFDLSKINGINEFTTKTEDVGNEKAPKTRTLFYRGEKVFLVENKNTIEVRTDEKLAELLKKEYESVMESRYFGRGGIEIVLADQLKEDEIEDLIRLSYDLSI